MTHFRHRLLPLAAGLALIVAPAVASAHRMWMVPSATTLSGNDDWVTVDAAVSNDLFYPDHFPIALDGIKVWAPDGSPAKIENGATGRYRSTFDVHLTQKGTWKIGSGMSGVMGSYTLNGEKKRVPRGTAAADIAKAIPAGASDVQIGEIVNRNEIFVTSGAPTTTVFKPTGTGIELQPITHPNDLVVGEPARFRFLIDGKPAAALPVVAIRGGQRYVNTPEQILLTTDAKGEVAIPFKQPGFYWINATAEDKHSSVPQATSRRLGYVTVVEVMAP